MIEGTVASSEQAAAVPAPGPALSYAEQQRLQYQQQYQHGGAAEWQRAQRAEQDAAEPLPPTVAAPDSALWGAVAGEEPVNWEPVYEGGAAPLDFGTNWGPGGASGSGSSARAPAAAASAEAVRRRMMRLRT